MLDPVDGTRAFITNCFLFGTLIALERDDGAGFRPVLGVIAHSARRPGADRPWPALHAVCQRRLDAAGPCAPMRTARGCDGARDDALDHRRTARRGETDRIETIIRAAKLYRTWGDCFGYFALATAGADLMLDPTLAHWDVAAIVPVVEARRRRGHAVGPAVIPWRSCR